MFNKIVAWFKRLWATKQSGQMEVVESTDEPQPLPEPTDTIALVDVSGPDADYACGHRHPVRFAIDLYGQKLVPKEGLLAKREKCANCHLAELKKITIRCAKCGFVIMPGEGVALYSYDKKLFTKPEWVTTVGEEGHLQCVIGCLRWDCCPSGGFFAGHWMGDSFQPAFAGGTAAGEVMRTGKVVVVSTK